MKKSSDSGGTPSGGRVVGGQWFPGDRGKSFVEIRVQHAIEFPRLKARLFGKRSNGNVGTDATLNVPLDPAYTKVPLTHYYRDTLTIPTLLTPLQAM